MTALRMIFSNFLGKIMTSEVVKTFLLCIVACLFVLNFVFFGATDNLPSTNVTNAKEFFLKTKRIEHF